MANGGELLIGGGTGSSDKGWFLEPAVIAEPADTSRLMREEVFGPVLPVSRFTDFDDAIRRANDTQYGLGLVDLDARRPPDPPSGSGDRIGHDLGQPDPLRLRRASVRGVKASGYGKEHGIEALDSYVEIKSVVVGGLA